MLYRLLLLALLLQSAASFMFFQTRIPNGDRVPSPCAQGELWPGVGHLNKGGTGARNPFGLDFYAAGTRWTGDLCRKDSDGDFKTNGQELGDPNCTWSEGQTPSVTQGLSHPGICEPIDSHTCQMKAINGSTDYTTQQQWTASQCKSDVFNCSALSEPGLMNITVRIPPGTAVPAKETTYMCMIFNLTELGVPSGQDFHIVAVTPLIVNRNVLHHMVLSACTNTTPTTSEPYECGMSAADTCQDMMSIWTVGLNGECFPSAAGVRIGPGGSQIIALQLHWNNPQEEVTFQDSSGLTVHYTSKLRTYDAAVLTTGSLNFYLPPRMPSIFINSLCSSSCTKNLIIDHINVFSAWDHMHYKGYTMSSEVTRNGQHVTYLTNDTLYSYDSPKVYQFETPFVMLPGDEIVTKCGFTTANINKTTFFGEATSEEMCFVFISYYPKRNLRDLYCADSMGVSYCNPDSWDNCSNPYAFYMNIEQSNVFKEVSKNCRKFYPCVTECVDTIVKYMKTDPCMQGDIWQFEQAQLSAIKSENASDFLSRIASCKTEVYLALNPSSGQTTPCEQTCPTSKTCPPVQSCPSGHTMDDDDHATTTTSSVIVLVIGILLIQIWS